MAHIVEFNVAALVGRKAALQTKLNRDVNVFFGLNGSGKTSLLKILHAALANETRSLLNVPFANASVEIQSDGGKVFTATYDKIETDGATF